MGTLNPRDARENLEHVGYSTRTTMPLKELARYATTRVGDEISGAERYPMLLLCDSPRIGNKELLDSPLDCGIVHYRSSPKPVR